MTVPFMVFLDDKQSINLIKYKQFCKISSMYGCSKVVVVENSIEQKKLEEILQIHYINRVNTDIMVYAAAEFINNSLFDAYFGWIDQVIYIMKSISQIDDLAILQKNTCKLGIKICVYLELVLWEDEYKFIEDICTKLLSEYKISNIIWKKEGKGYVVREGRVTVIQEENSIIGVLHADGKIVSFVDEHILSDLNDIMDYNEPIN